jgi:penicillin-binding protein 2
VRLSILLVVVVCLFGALLARLWFLQVINAPRAQAVAQDNGVRVVYSPAPRGLIMDRKGNILVYNVNEPVIEVNKQVAAVDSAMQERLAPLLGMTMKQLKTAIDNPQYGPYAPVPVKTDATPGEILYVQENQGLFPGVTAASIPVRKYTPLGVACGNILGYVGQIDQAQLAKLKVQGYQPGDNIGLAGVEATYESYLRGSEGVTKVQVNSQGQVLSVLSRTAPVPGDNIRLSIDAHIQVAAETALAQGMSTARHTFDKVTGRNFQAPAGSVVVEDPKNGQIVALVTEPTYNPAEFIGGISNANYQALLDNPEDPLLDRSIQGQYAPGSTFKLVTATAGLKYGLITPTSTFDDTGSITIGNFIAHNDNGAAYGIIDLPTAITVSSDNFFNTIGLNLWYGRARYGDTALQKVANEYGFGTPTGIALPDEAPGKIPTPESYIKDHEQAPTVFKQSQWYAGNSDGLAIGQDEVLVTPLQLANAYATFANGGTLYTPQLVMDAETAAGKVIKTFPPQPVRTITIQPAWRVAMLTGFEGAVNAPGGTAYGVFRNTPLASMDLAGKTGTAQVLPPRQDTSVFTSFAPAYSPQYVVDAFVEEAGYGASVAAPVVREVYDNLFNLTPQPVTYSAVGAGGQN